MDQEARVPEPLVDRQVPCLLGHPGTVRVGGHPCEMDAPRAVLDPEQHIQRSQPDRLHGKEVAGHDPLRLRAEKLAPRGATSPRCRAKLMPSEERPDRGRTDPDPELAQLALDPHAAPARILPRQPQHQLPKLRVERRSTCRSAPKRPLPPHQLALPTQKRLRRHARTPTIALAAAGRWPRRGRPDHAGATPAVSPSAEAHRAGAEAPRSRPRVRQPPNHPRRGGPVAVRARARGRRPRRPDPTDTCRSSDQGFRPRQPPARLSVRVPADHRFAERTRRSALLCRDLVSARRRSSWGLSEERCNYVGHG